MIYTCLRCQIAFRAHKSNHRKYCSAACYHLTKTARLGRNQTKAEIVATYRVRHRSAIQADGRAYYHRTARASKNKRLKTRYGVTIEWFDTKVKEQNNLCESCGNPEKAKDHRTGIRRSLSVDHDHDTGAVRGLLCAHCNAILGALETHYEIVRQLNRYVKKYGKNNLLDE